MDLSGDGSEANMRALNLSAEQIARIISELVGRDNILGVCFEMLLQKLQDETLRKGVSTIQILGTFGFTYAASLGVLSCLGFGSLGVVGGSLAATLQSVLFGASVPAGGWFATMTSLGMTGGFPMIALGLAGVTTAVVAVSWIKRWKWFKKD